MGSKWKSLLSLLVHNPPLGEFSSKELDWSEVEYNLCSEKDIVAWIQRDHIDDFLRGECKRPGYPTTFRIQDSTYNHEPYDLQKFRIDRSLQYIMPQDEAHYDISKVPKVGQNSRPNRKHLRRGCQCHFSIRVLMKLQDRALITYNKMDHRDHEGNFFHGKETDNFRGSRCSLAPHISGTLKDWVESFLLLGLTPELVHKKHRHMVHEKLTLFNGQTERDDFLTKDDICNIEGKMKEVEYKFELNDADNVRTFATKNPQKFMLYTILAFDNMHNGLPVAWVLMSRAIVPDLTLWMRKLVVSVHCHMLEWKPNDFMVDDARAEIVAI
ncbi:hypothetical protein KI387_003270, partial [Taxus chinensis]